MDAVSYSLASKQAQRIEKFIENPDSTSGILTQPSVIQAGEIVNVPVGRTAILANTQIDGDLVIDGDVFIPTGSSIDFSNGIKVNGTNIALSIPTSYHLLSGNLSVDNTVLTNGFGTTLYTGNGTTQSINTGIDMSTQWGSDASETFGGLVWLKSRSLAQNNDFTDTVRGATKTIRSDSTGAELIMATNLTSFNNNGFSVSSNVTVNSNLATYASWNFQTTHRVTGTTNHGKAYTCHFNPFTGFTIVKYEGSGLAGHEIPHHLGRKLGIAFTKTLTSTADWLVSSNIADDLLLNTTASASLNRASLTDNALIDLAVSININTASTQYILYGWANSYFDEKNTLIGNYEIGIYQGTGATGNKVTTRGKPAWIMIKRLDSTSDWHMFDNQRDDIVSSVNDGVLWANTSGAEATTTNFMSLVPNDGFIINDTTANTNASGGQYLYMVAYDNDTGSGKSKYPKATDTANVQINNGIIPLAHGIDSNGSKNSIVVANETITGLTYTEGKNYLYKTDTGYGVKAYEPRYLASELVRRFAGEQPDYYDVESNKWFNCDAGAELVTNGTFTDGTTTGWTGTPGVTGLGNSTISIVNNTLKVLNATAVYGTVQTSVITEIGKKYKLKYTINIGSLVTSYGLLVSTTSTIQGDIINNSALGFGSIEVEFVARSSTTYISFYNSNQSGGFTYIDNVSCFTVDIIQTTEITESRNYMNHIVHADADGGVLYVEEIPKIEYKNVIKAEEYLGKNACTAWAKYDVTTTPPTFKDGFNAGALVRTATGEYDFYTETPYDTLNACPIVGFKRYVSSLANTNYIFQTSLNKFHVSHVENGVVQNGEEITIHIFGGKN